jgi:hypothetical protein
MLVLRVKQGLYLFSIQNIQKLVSRTGKMQAR